MTRKKKYRAFGHGLVLVLASNAHNAIESDPSASESQKATRHWNTFFAQLLGHGIVEWLADN